MNKQTILAGDIGGTKTTLALYESTGKTLLENTYQNNRYNSLQQVITTFLVNRRQPPVKACFGIAGPIRNNRVQMTNLNWLVDSSQLANHFNIEQVLLVNDLVATTAGAVILPSDKLVTINAGQSNPQGAIGVLAPGTGLGESFAVPVNQRLQAFPSEGGHSSFAPRNQEQIDLLQFMRQRKNMDHISVEQVCSGMAIPDLYAYMTQSCREQEWMCQRLAETDDHTPVIVQAANEAIAGGDACEPATRTVRLFIDILAAEAANLALKMLTTGGIFLGGGMPPRLLPFFDSQRFMDIFCRGVYQEMLADIPIHIIQDAKTALVGAREIAMSENQG